MVKTITSKTGSNDISATSQTDEEERWLIQLLVLLKTELNAIQQHILLLRYLEKFSLNETALIVGKSLSNVTVTQNRAIRKLAQKLNSPVGATQEGFAFGAAP